MASVWKDLPSSSESSHISLAIAVGAEDKIRAEKTIGDLLDELMKLTLRY